MAPERKAYAASSTSVSTSESTLAPSTASLASSSTATLTPSKHIYPHSEPFPLPAEPFLSRSLPLLRGNTAQRLRSLGYPSEMAEDAARAAKGDPHRASILACHAAHRASGEAPPRMCPRCVEIARRRTHPEEEEEKKKKSRTGLYRGTAAVSVGLMAGGMGGGGC